MLPILCLTLLFASLTATAALPAVNGDPGNGAGPDPTSQKKVAFPANLAKNLRYGPEYGVQYSQMSHHPKYFDDTVYLGIKGDNVNYRRLETFFCWKTPSYEKNILSGEQATYAFGQNRRSTNLHGWRGFFAVTAFNSYTLLPGEHFVKFTVRACDGRFWGINAVTNNNKGTACGRYWMEKGDKNCEVKDLVPDPGYHIIGLYGDGNGVAGTKRQGIRGLGLITMKDKP